MLRRMSHNTHRVDINLQFAHDWFECVLDKGFTLTICKMMGHTMYAGEDKSCSYFIVPCNHYRDPINEERYVIVFEVSCEYLIHILDALL